MKNIILLVLILVIGNTFGSLAQTAYYDALKLKEEFKTTTALSDKIEINLTKENLIKFNSIMMGYMPNGLIKPDDKDSVIFVKIKEELKNNPFIEVGSTGLSSDLLKGLSKTRTSELLSTVGNSIGGLNVSTFADGIAQFLIERAKEELNVAFFEHLKKKFSIYPEFKILFPNTHKLLNNFEAWNYSNIINTLRESFDKDLKSLLQNIPELANIDIKSCNKDKDCEKRVTDFQAFSQSQEGRIFLSAVLLGNGFISGEKLPDVIHKISGPNYMDAGFDPAVIKTFTVLDILSYSVKSNKVKRNYIEPAEFKVLKDDQVTRDLFLGLVFQKLKNKDVIPQNINLEADIPKYIDQLLNAANQIQSAADQLAQAKQDGEANLDPYRTAMFEASKSFLETVILIIDGNSGQPLNIQFVAILNSCKKTLEIAHDITVKNYSAAVVGTLNILTEKIPASEFSREFVKYGSFAANVVQAKTSSDVNEAIKAIALPAGSASIKKKTAFNIALNAYLGGFLGKEYLAQKTNNNWKTISGVYTPIGVTFSAGIKGSSISLLLNVLDIGAFTAYRLKDDSTAVLPEVKIQNIFAPGVGLVYGFPKIPLSIGYTYQLGPALREINAETAVTDKLNKRWQFFIAVDIPLINFYSSRSKKQL